MRARVCIPLVGGGRRLGYLWLFEEPPVSAGGAAAGARRGGGGGGARRSGRRRAAHPPAQGAAARHGAAGRRTREAGGAQELEADHYLPLRPVRVWVAAPAEPAGDEWSAEALDRLRARLAAKQAICAELDGRLVCLAGERATRRGDGGARGAQRAAGGDRPGRGGGGPAGRGHVTPASAGGAAGRGARGVEDRELGCARAWSAS